jgi:alanine dehydrogenase
MVIGVPKEIKADEHRVSMIPVGVEELVRRGHKVLVQKGCGLGSGLDDREFVASGAEVVESPKEIFERAEMVVKVKEPLPKEYPFLRDGLVVFTYFHFAASEPLTTAIRDARVVAIAYETIRTEKGDHPLLTPMSEVAGKMSIQQGAKYLERPMLGRGILLGGVPGVAPADVVIVGGGIVGTNAAKVAAGLGARVIILDINLDRLRYLNDIMPPNVVTLMSDAHTIRECIRQADLLVGAVLIEGARAPVLITREMLRTMRPGSVIVDVAVDQGGCVETTRPTTHREPTFVEEDIIHYCVPNMPGAVGRTSTYALANVTLPYVLELASKGYKAACRDNVALRRGVNIHRGTVTNRAVAETFGLPCEEFRP